MSAAVIFRQRLRISNRQPGMTLVELLVALAIGSFLMIGAVQIYSQSREAFVINESIARVQETAQFAMDTIEADIRMASNWGMHSRGIAVEGRSSTANANPLGLPIPTQCGDDWALDFSNPIEGDNNDYALPCPPTNAAGPQSDSDTITVRRTTVAPTGMQAGRLQIQSTRIQAQVFADGVRPGTFAAVGSQTHDLLVNSYYVAADSDLIPGVPTLRRKTLTVNAGSPDINDEEVAPGVENIQLQFGVDVDADNTVDRYVDPGDPILIDGAVGFVPDARVLTARIWLVIRAIRRENGLVDNLNYSPGDVNLGTYNDAHRRLQVSKTILLRNARI